MLRISTGSFSALKGGSYVQPVSVALRTPEWVDRSRVPRYVALAPDPRLLSDYKGGRVSMDGYICRYWTNVLSILDRRKVLSNLERMAAGRGEVTLLCWEGEDEFCHRHVARMWLEGRSLEQVRREMARRFPPDVQLDLFDDAPAQTTPERIHFAAIGSRRIDEFPKEAERYAAVIRSFSSLQTEGGRLVMRSGGAPGCDRLADMNWNGDSQIILPWADFEEGRHRGAVVVYRKDPEAVAAVNRLHPSPLSLSSGSRSLLERDVWQVIGPLHQDGTREDASRFVICWTEGGSERGGTAMAIRCARENGIPVYNTALEKDLSALRQLWKDIRQGACPSLSGNEGRSGVTFDR